MQGTVNHQVSGGIVPDGRGNIYQTEMSPGGESESDVIIQHLHPPLLSSVTFSGDVRILMVLTID